MKKTIALLLLCLGCLSNSFGKQPVIEKKEYTLLNYDRAYLVDISVDTTMRLNELYEYKDKKSARYTTPHKVHCDFKMLYLWKNNFMVRALVHNLKALPRNSINLKTIHNKYFEAEIFREERNEYACYYNDDCFRMCIGYAFPPPVFVGQVYVPDYYNGPYLLNLNNKLYSLDFQFVDFLRCTPPSPHSKKQSIYCSWNQHYSGSFNDIFTGKNDINILKNYIWQSLFINHRNVLIPEALPSMYADYKGFVYNKTCCKGSDIHVKPLTVKDKVMYRVEDMLTMCNGDYRYKQHLLYIPHVLYMPYSRNVKFISLDKNGRIVNNADYYLHYFRYKINAINGQSFAQFMAGYKDDFRAKIHISKKRKPVNQYNDTLPIQRCPMGPPRGICHIAEYTTPPPITPNPVSPSNENEIYNLSIVQVMPNFPGGINALYEYINTHRQYPPSAREAGIEGRVIVGFVVEKDGRFSNMQVLRSLDQACDEEAVRLIKSMPAWTPGKQGDKVLRVRMTLPIVFKLDNN